MRAHLFHVAAGVSANVGEPAYILENKIFGFYATKEDTRMIVGDGGACIVVTETMDEIKNRLGVIVKENTNVSKRPTSSRKPRKAKVSKTGKK